MSVIPEETIEIEDMEGFDQPQLDAAGNVVRIDHSDGSVTVSTDENTPIEVAIKVEKPSRWFDNLVSKIAPDELSRIAEDLMRGVEADLGSRAQWIDDRAKGIRLLGLKIEQQGAQGAADGAPLEGMSRVRHPLLLEAVLRFQANARSELLPTDGPVKVRDDGNVTLERDSLASALQKDMNHYLTSTAVEYYPDTDRMLLMLGFGGCSFKKVYYCPLRQRPVSESIDADHLIVNDAATSIETAKRVTHEIFMKASTVRRMQLIGAYRDIELGDALPKDTDAVDDAKAAQQGVTVDASRPEDRDREIYEIYCELDIKGFEHKQGGEATGLEIPYIVTIDKSSREVLAVVRNYDEDTKELPEARKTFVKYQFVPGLGFYDIGLLHILGNTTVAVTAAWREALDAGMFANFPGFLYADSGARQDTTQFRVPPGGGAQIRTNGMPINQAVMPLPYKEAGPAFMTLIEQMVETGQRVGGTAELQVGEGKADAPVGTTLALIEQATKILNAVHKRMHTAQDQEFALLKECFKQNPESFWKTNKRPATQWDQAKFMQAINDYDLIPKADPNTASQSQRILKIMGVKQLQASNPELYDAEKVDRAVLETMGWAQPDQFFKSPEERDQPSPEILKGMADVESDKKRADADMLRAQAAMFKAQQPQQQAQAAQEDPQIKLLELAMKAKQSDMQDRRLQIQDENRDKDREAKIQLERLRVDEEREDDARDSAHERFMQDQDHEHDRVMKAMEIAHDIKRQKEASRTAAKDGRR